MIDNVLWHGSVIEESDTLDEETKTLKELNRIIREDDRVSQYMLPISDGVSTVMKISYFYTSLNHNWK